ncbi:MAG: hypothetical protein JST90_09925 [Bacteroidetes bacterium]|nr:hypothetical protein [Bacteroidota bacterium]
MKKALSALAILAAILCLLPSCKKCYTCSTTCYSCTLRDSLGVAVDHQVICSDSLHTFKTQKDQYTAAGYNCAQTTPNYSQDYCVNVKDGSDQYALYYEGNGRYTCKEK